jgi:polyribonucleotide nucleotidyltransferase
MGQITPLSTSFNLPDGRQVDIETGKLASQAHGSAVIKCGNTMLLAVVVSAPEAREGQPFFPLSVDYQERFAAAGRIPGNFFRRETKLSDYEVLICRLVDRAIRPLFPDSYMNETQVIINLISGDEETLPDAMVALAASAALSVSDIPFAGPISEVRVAKINGEYKVNPNRTELEEATMDIIVAATIENVMMVEGEGNEVQESELIEAIQIGHDAIKVQCKAQLELAQKVGDAALIKREVIIPEENEEIKEAVAKSCKDKIKKIANAGHEKPVRKQAFQDIYDALIEQVTEEYGEEYMEEKGAFYDKYYKELKKKVIRDVVLDENVRLDGRKPNEIRPIWCEVDYLPSAHGSAVFTRGETQSLTSLTLGTKLDRQMIDNALDFHFDNFILHYNFPGYSVGEVKPQRGPGRREVGHANLAGRSLRKVLPDEQPYTLRIVSDILESNGSSSMATVCAGSLALMDAGLQTKAAVSGIAMGMIAEGDRYAILSDILGDEDALGDMDFKVTGTAKGITGCQMDIKIEGLSYQKMEEALIQAKEGRIHILNEMAKVLAEPREKLKPHAPRIVEVIIDKSFIGQVIGPGGKVIQEMQEQSGTVINIEEKDGKGIVSISGKNEDAINAVIEKINSIAFMPTVGDVFDGQVVSVMPYGVFVEFQGGRSGLLHVSEMSYTRIDNVEDVFAVGDEVKVKLIDIDPKSGKLRLSRKALMPRPEGSGGDERDSRDRGPRDDRRDGDRRDNNRRPPRRD